MKKYLEPAIHIFIWLLGFTVITAVIKNITPFSKADGTLFYPIVFGTAISIGLFYFNALVLIPHYINKKKTLRYIFLFTATFLLVTLLETLVDYFFFMNYYSTEHEPFLAQYITNGFINLGVLIFSLGYGLTKIWYKKEKINQKLKEDKLLTELDFLKAQLNPHFLFNVLNMAFSSATSYGDDRTADMIEKLASLMRYMLYESNVTYIELSKEVDYIKNYIELQKKRISDEMPVDINYKIDGNINKGKIAPLLLIPFIENAFKFGIKLGEKSEINIKLTVNESDFEFIVTNSLINISGKNSDKSSGLGLKNVKKRLDILYPNKHKLEITNSNYFTVKLKLEL